MDIQVYKPNASLAVKMAEIKQTASIQTNDIDLKNLEALEAFMDRFVNLCNSKVKFVCKYTPEELRKDIEKTGQYRSYTWQEKIFGRCHNKIGTQYILPSLEYFTTNFTSIVNNLSKDMLCKHWYLQKPVFSKYNLIDFDNLHILTDASVKEFAELEGGIQEVKLIYKELFIEPDKLDNKIRINRKKYKVLQMIFANSTFHKISELEDRIAVLHNDGNVEWKCQWIGDMKYVAFLKLYKMLYNNFDLNKMEAMVEGEMEKMLCLSENLRCIINLYRLP